MKNIRHFTGRVPVLAFGVFTNVLVYAQPAADTAVGRGILSLVSDSAHEFATVRLATDTYTGRVTLTAATDDVGQSAELYAVAEHGGQWYLKTPAGWQGWDEQLATLAPFDSVTLQPETALDLFESEPLLAGDYAVYAAYKVNDKPLVVSPSEMTFTIESARTDSLHRFSSATAMENYLKEGMQNTSSDLNYYYRLETLSTTAADSGASPSVSTTNVQVAGVDEADTI